MPRTMVACLHPRRALRRAGRVLALAALVATLPVTAEPTAAATSPAPGNTAPAPAAATGAAPAAATGAASDPAAMPPADNGSELVCRRVRETGSNISKRVCKTRAQLAAEAEAARGMLEQRNRSTNSVRGGKGG